MKPINSKLNSSLCIKKVCSGSPSSKAMKVSSKVTSLKLGQSRRSSDIYLPYQRKGSHLKINTLQAEDMDLDAILKNLVEKFSRKEEAKAKQNAVVEALDNMTLMTT